MKRNYIKIEIVKAVKHEGCFARLNTYGNFKLRTNRQIKGEKILENIFSARIGCAGSWTPMPQMMLKVTRGLSERLSGLLQRERMIFGAAYVAAEGANSLISLDSPCFIYRWQAIAQLASILIDGPSSLHVRIAASAYARCNSRKMFYEAVTQPL